MRFEDLGKAAAAFAIAPQRKSFGSKKVLMEPAWFADWFGKDYSCTTRYLYMIPLYIFYADCVDEDAKESVKGGVVKGRDDLIRGDVLIFGRKDDLVRSLTDFEMTAIDYNISIEKLEGGFDARLNNVSLKPREMVFQLDEPEETDE